MWQRLAGKSDLWDKGFQFGDWLDPTAPPDNPAQARTDKAIVASAYFVYSSRLVAQAALALGRPEDGQRICIPGGKCAPGVCS